MANGNGVTVGGNTRVTLTLLLAIAGLVLAAAAGWMNVWANASNALPRAEAYRTFVSKEAYGEDRDELCARLERMESKIDRLIEKGGQ